MFFLHFYWMGFYDRLVETAVDCSKSSVKKEHAYIIQLVGCAVLFVAGEWI